MGGKGDYSAGNVQNIKAGTYTFKAKVHIKEAAPSHLVIYFNEFDVGLQAGNFSTLSIPLEDVPIGGDPTKASGWQTISGTVELPEYTAMKTGLRTNVGDYTGIVGPSTMYVDNLELFANSSTGIDSDFVVDFEVFPNPATHEITVNTKLMGDLFIYDLSGRIIKNYNGLTGEFKIPLTSMKKGIYFLQFVSEGVSVVKKVLVQ